MNKIDELLLLNNTTNNQLVKFLNNLESNSKDLLYNIEQKPINNSILFVNQTIERVSYNISQNYKYDDYKTKLPNQNVLKIQSGESFVIHPVDIKNQDLLLGRKRLNDIKRESKKITNCPHVDRKHYAMVTFFLI